MSVGFVQKLTFRLAELIATFFYVGKIKIMPGTFGSLAATILALCVFYQPYDIGFSDFGLNFAVGGNYIDSQYLVHFIVFCACVFYLIGLWSSDYYTGHKLNNADKDPSEVVIDEVAGIFTTVSLIAIGFVILLEVNPAKYIIYISISFYYFVAAFVLFRVFDIIKPLSIGKADRKYSGGFGIMIDDELAAIYAAVSFFVLFFIAEESGLLIRLVTLE